MATNQKTIAIIGGTGVSGGSVARHFASHLGFRIRTISRQPDSEAANVLRKDVPGVEVCHGDLGNVASLYQLFRPANVIYMATYFWKLRNDPQIAEQAQRDSVSIDEAALCGETQHCRNLFDAIALVLLEQDGDYSGVGSGGIQKVVISTLPNPRAVSQGAYAHAYHFESRAKGLEVLYEGAKAAKPGYQLILDRISYIYTGVYLQSFFNPTFLSLDGRPIFGPVKQEDGTFLFQQVARPPFKRIPFICPPKDLGRLVQALVLDASPGCHLFGGQPLTLEEFVRLWGKTLKVPVRWQPVDIDDMLAQVPQETHGFLRGPLESSAFVTKYGFDGGLGALWPSELGVQANELVEMSNWIKETDWSDWPEVLEAWNTAQ